MPPRDLSLPSPLFVDFILQRMIWCRDAGVWFLLAVSALELVHTALANGRGRALDRAADLFGVELVEGVADDGVLRPVYGWTADDVLRCREGCPFSRLILQRLLRRTLACIIHFLILVAAIIVPLRLRRIDLAVDEIPQKRLGLHDSSILGAAQGLDVRRRAVLLDLEDGDGGLDGDDVGVGVKGERRRRRRGDGGLVGLGVREGARGSEGRRDGGDGGPGGGGSA